MTQQIDPVADAENQPGIIPFQGRPHMMDGKGRLVPVSLIKGEDMAEDQMVRKIMGHAEELSAQIARFRGHTFEDIGSHLDDLAEKYGSKRGGQKGNMTFTSFDACQRVQVAVSETIAFGASLQIAKDLIDECIDEWSEGIRDEIKALVSNAFQTNQEGKVNRAAIFRLRTVKIDDERWKRAMAAINDSIRVDGSRVYVRFYKREHPQAAWQAITIDLASA